jgi:hypothetical protein
MNSTLRLLPALALAVLLTSTATAQAPEVPNRLQAFADRLAQRHRLRVVVDPEIAAPAARMPDPGQAPRTALDLLCARLPGTAWRKVYLPERLREEPSPERLGALARSLAGVEPRDLLVERGDPPQRLSLERDATGEAQLRTQGFSSEPVYLVYSTVSTSDGRPPEARIADLQRQQLALSVGEAELPRSIGQLMQLITRLPPRQMERLAGPTVQASYRLWDATPPEQRETMMRQTRELLQPLLEPGAGAGPRGAGPAAPAEVDHFPELARVGRELEQRFETKVLLDPTLLVAERPVRPKAEQPLPEALDTAVQPVTGATWRRVRISAAHRRKLAARGAAESLARAVRQLELVELSRLALVDPATGASTVFRMLLADPSEEGAKLEAKLAPEPVYLIFSAAASAAGRTREERLASVQRQQFEEMFRMKPEQLERSLQDLFRSYDGASPATQKRLLALPLMSGMMAGWFPRQAKEQQQ